MKKRIKIKNIWFSSIAFIFLYSARLLSAGTAPELEIMGPKRGEEVPFGRDTVIAISIYDPDADTDITTVELMVDGVDVTREAQVSAFLVTFKFQDTTVAGKHTVSFKIKDGEGNVSELASYFTIPPKPKERKVAVTAEGNIKTVVEYGREADQNTVGTLAVDVYGHLTNSIDYSLTFDMTNEESWDGQRVSVYRLDLYTNIMSIVLGNTTPSFSTYTVNGAEVFGVHLLPQFGAYGMELVCGQILRYVDKDDPKTATFKRMLYGGKIKVGNENTFRWGLTFLKVTDKTDSMSASLAALDNTPRPKDNIVLGMDINFSLIRGLVSFKGEANESLLSEDITTGAMSEAEKVEWLFAYNYSTVPVVPGFHSLAANAALKIGPISNNTFNTEFSYVGPGYNSLANPAITKDRVGFKARDTLWLFNEKLFLSSAFQYYVNNLKQTLADTTNNVGYSCSTYVYPNDYLSINAGLDLQTVTDNDDIDVVNTTITGGATQNLDILITNTNIYFNGVISLSKDKVTPSKDGNIIVTRLGAISYFMGFPLDTKIVLGVDFGDIPNSLYMEGKGGYRFLKNENLYPYADIIYETGPKNFNLALGVDYDIPSGLTLEGELEYINSDGSRDILISAFATQEF